MPIYLPPTPMLTFNKVLFTGRITDSVRTIRQGDESLARFTLIQKEQIKLRRDTKEVTTYLNCLLIGKKAEDFAAIVKQGTPICVEGKLERDPHVSIRLRVSSWQFLLPSMRELEGRVS